MAGNTIKLNMWASQVALTACYMLMIGGVVALFYGGMSRTIGAYTIALGGFLMPLVWPARWLKGMLMIIHGQFWFTGPFLIICAVPGFIAVPTTVGSIALAVSGILYIIAAIRKEASESCDSLNAPPRAARE